MKLRRPRFMRSRGFDLLKTWPGRGAFLACACLILGGGVYGVKENYDPGPLSAAQYRGEPINGYHSHADFEKDCRHCHAPVRCLSPNLCQDCHKEIARQRSEAEGLHGLLPGTDKCRTYHAELKGRDAVVCAVPFTNINHEGLTGFSLTRHRSEDDGRPAACQDCHQGGRYERGSVACYDCHHDRDPGYLDEHTERFGSDCAGCHDGRDRIVDVDHSVVYALDGAHAEAECIDCHGDEFLALGRDCADCHKDPDVHAGHFGLDCERCHTAVAWVPAELREHTFHLDHGSEEVLACETCHAENYVAYTCYGCHDHEPGEIQVSHAAEDIVDVAPCSDCHPTGRPGEALAIVQAATRIEAQGDQGGQSP